MRKGCANIKSENKIQNFIREYLKNTLFPELKLYRKDAVEVQLM